MNSGLIGECVPQIMDSKRLDTHGRASLFKSFI
jgi:hypothetical protein